MIFLVLKQKEKRQGLPPLPLLFLPDTSYFACAPPYRSS